MVIDFIATITKEYDKSFSAEFFFIIIRLPSEQSTVFCWADWLKDSSPAKWDWYGRLQVQTDPCGETERGGHVVCMVSRPVQHTHMMKEWKA